MERAVVQGEDSCFLLCLARELEELDITATYAEKGVLDLTQNQETKALSAFERERLLPVALASRIHVYFH
jgi:hypothetical protein